MVQPASVNFDEDVEEGEIGPMDDYDPALEFDSNEVSLYPLQLQPRVSSPSPPPVSTAQTTVLRLIRLHSSILSRSKRVAVLDGHPEVSIGRDVAPAARVRLKEMAVSKFHASIYWDGMRHEWAIVDMGSMHGTFVRSAQGSSRAAGAGTRLSDARKSSMPRVLHHLDEITIGGTTFLVHEHADGRPCPECTTDGAAEIPLFPVRVDPSSGADPSRKRKREVDQREIDPKRALSQLKSSLMSRHAASSSASPSTYKDRSALRRELHPEPRVPQFPPPPPQPVADPRLAAVGPARVAYEMPPPPDPPAALPSSNIGHKLLMQQGWSPGTALGENPADGLIEPINLSSNSSRAGLGIPTTRPASQPPGDWKEQAKQRRWEGARSN